MTLHNRIPISKNPAIFGGRPIINGRRVTVHAVVVHHRAGMSVEELAEGYNLTLPEVEAALSYYQEHRETIDRQIADDEQESSRRASSDASRVAERTREIGRNLRHSQAT